MESEAAISEARFVIFRGTDFPTRDLSWNSSKYEQLVCCKYI